MDPVTARRTPTPYASCPGRRTGPPPVVAGPSSGVGAAQLKESPQAQELPALGLSMVNPCFSIVSEKSIVAPSR